MDFKNLGSCIPGVDELKEIDDRNYEGAFRIKIGPISANFHGRVSIVEMVDETHRAAMSASAKDARAASTLQARMTMAMHETAPGQTEVAIDTELNVLGKLGQFGYWIFKKKANDVLDEFTARVRARIE